ncbi:MAG: hypothetical protein NW226_12270 [Microscillaceae bacterium]|nr:hypothetical protein [Microscillaceae bacterium]
MRDQEKDRDKLEDILYILKTNKPHGALDWETVGEEIRNSFDHLSDYQKQTLLNSLSLIIHSKDQLNNARIFLNKFKSTTDTKDKKEE